MKSRKMASWLVERSQYLRAMRLRRRSVGPRYVDHSQNGNHSKINLASMENFRDRKSPIQFTTNHHNPTTTSPPKNHVLPPVFSKTPCKNAKTPRKKKLPKSNRS